MTPALISVATFAAVTLAVLGATSILFDVVLRKRALINSRLREELVERASSHERRSAVFKDPSRMAREASGGRARWADRLETLIEQSGVPISLRQTCSMVVATSLAAASTVMVATWSWWLSASAGLTGLSVPWAYILRKRQVRLAKLRSQLPEAFELMGRSVQAGQTIAAAFQTIADEHDAPLSEEFSRCHEQQNLGLPYEVAMRELARRTGVVELQMFVVALLVQRKSGGSPVELLSNLAGVMRKRMSMQGKIRALTGEGRMQAAVLLLMPVGMFIAIWFLDVSYARVLWDRPRLLGGALVAELLGAVWIRKIVNVDC